MGTVVPTAVGASIAVGFGLDWRLALVAAMGIAMSSTAIAVQTMTERGVLQQPAGQAAFSVLLFQDLAVIPLMLLLALLVPHSASAGVEWLNIAKAVGVILFVVLAGKYLLRPVLRYIANTGLREIFIAFALFLVMGVALLMQLVGLSMALGAFLAGVLLADSEYRQELELDIDPFKGLLAFFLLEMGLVTSSRLREVKSVGAFLVLFGVLMPVLSAVLGAAAGTLCGLSIGGAAILATLAASASYIAAPAAV